MPPKAAPLRAEQLAWISKTAHERLTDARIGEILDEIESNDDMDAITSANIRLAREAFDSATKLPTEFVEEMAKHRSKALISWTEAREKDDFSIFRDDLEIAIGHARMKADFFGYDGLRYDALLDLYESGLTVERLDPLFSGHRENVAPLIKEVVERDEGPDLSWVTESTWSQKAQEELSQSVSEAIGLALPYSAGPPAPDEGRDKYALESGKAVMDLLENNIRPRDIVTKESFINAAVVVAATGGSTNGALHLPAMANEIGIDFDLFDVADIFKSTPYIADLKPGGNYVAKDMHEAGGVPMLLRTLLDEGFINGDCLTVTGNTLEENISEVVFDNTQKVIYPASSPITETGGVVGLKGNFAPDGAIVKVAGMEHLMKVQKEDLE